MGAIFSEANLSNVFLREANLMGSDLSNANLLKANLMGAYLVEANLVGAENLKEALNLGYASYGNTKVTADQKEIIEEFLGEKINFVVVE